MHVSCTVTAITLACELIIMIILMITHTMTWLILLLIITRLYILYIHI